MVYFMKRRHLFVIALTTILIFSSCDKTYKCQCLYQTEAQSNSSPTRITSQSWQLEDIHEIKAKSREDAERQCKEIEANLNKEGIGFNTVFMNNQTVVYDKKYQCYIVN